MADNPRLFIGVRNEALGDTAMSATLSRLGCNATVHGMRSAFSTWAHEQTAHSNHVIEMALAHAVGSDVEKVYRRTDLFNKRRKLMEQWATYCCSPPAARRDKTACAGAAVTCDKSQIDGALKLVAPPPHRVKRVETVSTACSISMERANTARRKVLCASDKALPSERGGHITLRRVGYWRPIGASSRRMARADYTQLRSNARS